MRARSPWHLSAATVLLCAAFPLLAAAEAPAPAARIRSTPEQRDEVTITVYNQNFGLVREVRTVDLVRGLLELEFGGVASSIQPETVAVRSLAGEGAIRVLEQNYQYDLLNPQKLLEKYVGRQVKVYRWNDVTGKEEERTAEVLAASGGAILRIGDEITFDYPGRIAFPEIPKNLIARPSLVWLLESQKEKQKIEASYLANQLNWKSDYVLVLNPDDTKGDLTGWVTLTNQSGASYENAKLKLVAGDVQRLRDELKAGVIAGRTMEMAEAPAPQFREETFFEYHLYTLERPATLLDNEQKQITLLEAAGVPLAKRMILRGEPHWFRGSFGEIESRRKVGVFIEVENKEANQLGMPLPKGIVRVYKADREGGRQFVGEDEIDHTPRDERFRIKVGEAFDVVADRRQVEWRALGQCSSESAFEIEIRNHKEEAVEVEVIEPAAGDWEILSSSHPHTKEDAYTFSFRPKVPAKSSVRITYRVRVRWC